MMGLFGGPNLLNEGHFNPVPGMLLVEKRRRARTEMHERIGMQMQVKEALQKYPEQSFAQKFGLCNR